MFNTRCCSKAPEEMDSAGAEALTHLECEYPHLRMLWRVAPQQRSPSFPRTPLFYHLSPARRPVFHNAPRGSYNQNGVTTLHSFSRRATRCYLKLSSIASHHASRLYLKRFASWKLPRLLKSKCKLRPAPMAARSAPVVVNMRPAMIGCHGVLQISCDGHVQSGN